MNSNNAIQCSSTQRLHEICLQFDGFVVSLCLNELEILYDSQVECCSILSGNVLIK